MLKFPAISEKSAKNLGDYFLNHQVCTSVRAQKSCTPENNLLLRHDFCIKLATQTHERLYTSLTPESILLLKSHYGCRIVNILFGLSDDDHEQFAFQNR